MKQFRNVFYKVVSDVEEIDEIPESEKKRVLHVKAYIDDLPLDTIMLEEMENGIYFFDFRIYCQECYFMGLGVCECGRKPKKAFDMFYYRAKEFDFHKLLKEYIDTFKKRDVEDDEAKEWVINNINKGELKSKIVIRHYDNDELDEVITFMHYDVDVFRVLKVVRKRRKEGWEPNVEYYVYV